MRDCELIYFIVIFCDLRNLIHNAKQKFMQMFAAVCGKVYLLLTALL